MERPEQHVIDSKAEAILRYELQLLQDNEVGFVFRNLDCDYGIDLEIELFLKGMSQKSGIIKIQLKGSKSPNFTNNNKNISFSFQLHRGEYLIEQVTIPTVIVLVDVEKRIVYWTGIHTNKQLINAYNHAKTKFNEESVQNQNIKKKDKSFTIHFQTSNVLPATVNEMLLDLKKSQDILCLNHIPIVSDRNYTEFIKNSDDIDSELTQLRKKINISQIEKLERCIENNDVSEAGKQIEVILKGTEFADETKYYTLLRLDVIAFPALSSNAEYINYTIWQAEQLRKLSELSQSQEIVVDVYNITAINRIHAKKDFDLYMNHKMQESSDYKDEFWAAYLSEYRENNAKLFFDGYNKVVEKLLEALENMNIAIIPTICTKIIESSNLMLKRLQFEYGNEDAKILLESLEKILDLAVFISSKFNQQELRDYQLYHLAKHAITFGNQEDEEHLMIYKEKANNIAKKIISKELKRECQDEIDKIISNFQSISEIEWDENQPDWEAAQSFYRSQAETQGINLDLVEGKDESKLDFSDMEVSIAHMVHTGIKDLDATRVLKKCMFLVLDLIGSAGTVAAMLQLPTMQMKEIKCYKHIQYHGVGHISLDTAYCIFANEYCKNCKDCIPHEVNWIYTEPYCEEQKMKYQTALEDYKKGRNDESEH